MIAPQPTFQNWNHLSGPSIRDKSREAMRPRSPRLTSRRCPTTYSSCGLALSSTMRACRWLPARERGARFDPLAALTCRRRVLFCSSLASAHLVRRCLGKWWFVVWQNASSWYTAVPSAFQIPPKRSPPRSHCVAADTWLAISRKCTPSRRASRALGCGACTSAAHDACNGMFGRAPERGFSRIVHMFPYNLDGVRFLGL